MLDTGEYNKGPDYTVDLIACDKDLFFMTVTERNPSPAEPG